MLAMIRKLAENDAELIKNLKPDNCSYLLKKIYNCSSEIYKFLFKEPLGGGIFIMYQGC